MGNTEQLSTIKELARALLDEVEVLSEAQDITMKSDDGDAGEEDFYKMVEEYEKFLIRRALLKTRGNQARAARILRLKPTTLNHKMKIYNINTGWKETARGDGLVAAGRSESSARQSRGA